MGVGMLLRVIVSNIELLKFFNKEALFRHATAVPPPPSPLLSSLVSLIMILSFPQLDRGPGSSRKTLLLITSGPPADWIVGRSVGYFIN